MGFDKTIVEKELAKPIREISIIRLVDLFLSFGYHIRASDIHIDPQEDSVKIRMRVDGVMQMAFSAPKSIQDEIISRIKVLSDLRIDEHLAPQDGRFKFALEGKKIKFDVRVSIVPTYYGENSVMRLLVEQGKGYTLEDLNLSVNDFEKIKRAIKKTYGMILVTGPTGSGKTTSLYTLLKVLNRPEVTIITVEDPIEYSLDGVNQIQVNATTNLTFANGFRSILRQDPNIIMVGEIRDQETANIAINAALTGHLILSTLHTNDSATALPRLLDMKVEPFLIASTVNIVIAQRLVRKICPDCKMKKAVTPSQIQAIKNYFDSEESLKHLYAGKGCQTCENSGYLGRVGIYEILEVTELVRSAIASRQSAAEIKKLAIQEGMTTIFADGIRKAKEGLTTVEEVLRVMQE